ncbi:MAG: hypothetical protein U1F54_22745 [Burkholderiales bacterium]
MSEWLASGRLVDAILALMVVECIAIAIVGRRFGIALRDVAANLAAGAFLMLALRTAVTGAPAHWTLACLAGALVAHLADLASRRR